jgi:hypothetical protein
VEVVDDAPAMPPAPTLPVVDEAAAMPPPPPPAPPLPPAELAVVAEDPHPGEPARNHRTGATTTAAFFMRLMTSASRGSQALALAA